MYHKKVMLLFCVIAGCTTRENATSTHALSSGHASTIVAQDRAVNSDAATVSDADATSPFAVRISRPSPEAGPAFVRTEALQRAPISAEIAVWNQFRLTALIARMMHEYPAPTAPRFEQEVYSLSLVLPPSPTVPSAGVREAVCEELRRSQPAIVCLADTVELSGAERVRWSFAWRVEGANPVVDLGVPLRALSQVGSRVCVKSIELTAHTMELSLQAPDRGAIIEALALLAAAPRMSEIVVVRFEPNPAGILAVLSWPTDRADRSQFTLGPDHWPTRCEGHSEVLANDATALRATQTFVQTPPTEDAGAVLERASRRFLVTVGDRVGDAEITAISQASVRVRTIGSPPTARVRERVLRAERSLTDVAPPNNRSRRPLLPPEPQRAPIPRLTP